MRKNKGFTLIELMIVIAIIAIIAAIAIPNLMQSRLRANEATAVTCLRNYGTAQVTFQLGQQSSVPANSDTTSSGLRGFADNFRNLFYGLPRTIPTSNGEYAGDATRNLALISQAHADAFITAADAKVTPANVGSPTTPGVSTVYQGYHFAEDPVLADNKANGTFITNYGLLGLPANSATTGNNAFWMDSENTVMRKGLVATYDQDTGYTAIVTDGTPLTSGTIRATWSSL